MIPKCNRFHGHSSLNYVYKNGQAVRSRKLTIKVVNNPKRQKPRMAVIISKKVLKSAVKRNRVRRQVYAYISNLIPQLNDVYDIVFIITSGELYTENQIEIFNQINQLIDQLSIKKKQPSKLSKTCKISI